MTVSAQTRDTERMLPYILTILKTQKSVEDENNALQQVGRTRSNLDC